MRIIKRSNVKNFKKYGGDIGVVKYRKGVLLGKMYTKL